MIQNFVSKLNDKEKKIFYITIMIVSAALIDRLLLGPVTDRIDVIKDEISAQKDIIEGDVRFLSKKQQIIDNSQMYSKYFVDKIEDEDVINAQFLRIVERIATRNEVNLIKSNPTSSNKSKAYVEYYASLECSGTLKNMISFMHALNSTESLLKVVKFNMAPKRGTEDDVSASMTIVKLIMQSDVADQLVSK